MAAGFSITIPDAAFLPTTTAKTITALQGLVVTLHPSEQYGGNPVDVEIMHAVENEQGDVIVYGHPWNGEIAPRNTTIHIPLELIGSITVH